MTKSRVVLLIVFILLISAALALGGTYYFAKTPAGQSFLRGFLVVQSKAALAAQTPYIATSTVPSKPPGILIIPKTYATQDYFVSINNVLQDIFAINAVNAKLGPLLDSINRQMLSFSYVGFYEAMGQAHQLANKNQTLVSQLAFHLSALAAANTQTKDAITKVDTDMLIAKGGILTGALQTYASAVNSLLVGDTPTSAQIAEFQSQVNVATGASQSFADALERLLTHIAQGIQAAASSTPAR